MRLQETKGNWNRIVLMSALHSPCCRRTGSVKVHQNAPAPLSPTHGAPNSPANVLYATFPLLLQLHISLDGFLQVQDTGILYHYYS